MDDERVENVEELLGRRLATAFQEVAGPDTDAALRRSQHADFQADGALAAARTTGLHPREVAARVVARARLDDLCSAVGIGGPGFINLTLSAEVVGSALSAASRADRLVAPAAHPETVVIDYSAPNVAKEMHVGHLRSSIIGDSAARVLELVGHRVIRHNHIGDWGTPFGMLIEHLVDVGGAEAADELSVGDLDGFYKAARAAFDASPEFRERSRGRVVLLQSGDETSRRLWHRLIEESERHFLAVYDRLGLTLTAADFFGESRYNDDLPAVVDELDRLGLLRDSDGARCVFPAGFRSRTGEPLPLIVRKADGGYGYPATDLAAVRHRTQRLGATRLLYVVGLPQRQHFSMVFAAAAEAGWLVPPARAEHVGFGSILGTDGKALRSRAGASVKLASVLDEAVRRAAGLIAEKNPNLDEATRADVARAVGIGAVKYADLSTDRTRDYVFDFDRMLSFDGNTAPYLQYAHARTQSILRRAAIPPEPGAGPVPVTGRLTVAGPAEHALAIELLSFAAVVDRVAETLEFHRLAGYLHRLATAFTTFYERCPVLRADEETRRSRLTLCDLTGRVLRDGLGLLGIGAPPRM